MSGVLERMAKRARGALPTVEPRSSPRFAPAAAGFADTSAGIEEIFAEVQSSGAGMGSAPRRRPKPLMDGPEVKTARDPDDDAASNREAFSAPRAGQADRRDDRQQEVSGARSASRRPENSQLDAEENISTRHRQPIVENDRDEAVPQTQKSSKQASVQTEMHESQAERLVDSPIVEGIVVKEEESIDRAPTLARANAVEQRQRHEHSVAARNDAPATTSDSPAEQRTEIHISIGSIELRSARVEARPQPVPFRPLLTLSDYLGRKPGAGA